MSREAFERGNWQAVIEAHPLESHDPEEWLRYGVALLQTLTTGPDAGKQQQQAALAFVQAQREGASAEQVAEAQQRSALISLEEALTIAGIPVPQPSPAIADLLPEAAESHQRIPEQPLEALTATLARLFGLELPQQASVLEQLLVAKEELRSRQVGAAAVEAALRQEFPCHEQSCADAMDQLLRVLY